MKLLIDTVNKDFYMALIEGDKTLAFSHVENLIKKTEALPVEFEKLINETKIKAKDIKEIYVVNGPGSFMGIRAGMTFAKTLAYITKAKLLGIESPLFVSGGINGTYYVDAKSGKSFAGKVDNKEVKISMVDFVEDSTIDFEKLIQSPMTFLTLFTEVKDILNYEANYLKDPQIGGL